MLRIHVTSFFLVVTFLCGIARGAAKEVEYDRGSKEERQFLSAGRCVQTPCVITQRGAIRFPKRVAKNYRIQVGMTHRGSYRSIALFEKSTSLEQKLSERVFTRRPNRDVVNLERIIETGKTNTLYIYGLLLQYEFDEGDLLAIQLTSLASPQDVKEYFFRYHHDGYVWDLDIAFVQPINIFHPNPGDVIQAAYSTASLSFSVAKPMEPDKKYHLLPKVMRAVRFNIFGGLLLRKDVFSFNGDLITQEYFDGFGGAGITFFNFLAVGYGANFIRSPHTTFPFIGIEVRHLTEFLRALKKDTHSRWNKYLKEEENKGDN